jgi:uncharacterized iron-regulated membrane protein
MNNLPETNGKQDSPLWEKIREFRKSKISWAIGLLLLAALGIIVPIIPGLILIILIIALFKKGWMEKLRRRFRLWKIDDEEEG